MFGLVWLGWFGLVWLGSVWLGLGLDWLGLAWLGLALSLRVDVPVETNSVARLLGRRCPYFY